MISAVYCYPHFIIQVSIINIFLILHEINKFDESFFKIVISQRIMSKAQYVNKNVELFMSQPVVSFQGRLSGLIY